MCYFTALGFSKFSTDAQREISKGLKLESTLRTSQKGTYQQPRSIHPQSGQTPTQRNSENRNRQAFCIPI